MGEQARSNALRRFESREIRILISCKALDEGLNIPETDVGIVVSCTASDRQRIQRLGRILRRGGGSVSCLYYLYVADTAEGEVLLSELNGIPDVPVSEIEYLNGEGRFVNAAYAEAAKTVEKYIEDSAYTEENANEIKRNLRLGAVSGEWLLPEDICRELAKKAKSKTEVNYCVTMLMMIRARDGRL